MSSLLYRLGRACGQHAAVVVAAWVLALAGSAGGALLVGEGIDDVFRIPGTESQEAFDQLARVFPEVAGAPAQVVVVAEPGGDVGAPATREAVAAMRAEVEALGQVASVTDPWGDRVTGLVPPDGDAALVPVTMDVPTYDVSAQTREGLAAAAQRLEDRLPPGAQVHAGGDALASQVPGVTVTEVVGLGVALAVLLVLFRSLLAAAVPVVSAVLAVAVAVALVLAASAVTPVSSTAPMLAVMLGLAVGVDYGLFLLSRHRDQLGEGVEVLESVGRATATAGSAVVFAGVTNLIALAALVVARIPFLTTMGIAASVAVTTAVAVALTLVPAALALSGERLRPRERRGPVARGAAALTARVPDRLRVRPARAWVRLVTRVPAATVALVVAGLAVVSAPALGLTLALPDRGSDPVGSSTRATYDAVAEHLGPGWNGPLLVTVDVLSSREPVAVTEAVAADLRRVPGVAAVPLATPNAKGETAVVQVVPEGAPDSPGTAALVERLRAEGPALQERHGVGTAVTGITAVTTDVSSRLGGALLPFGLIVVALTLVLLAMVFRSVPVAVKTASSYLLSVGAAFGITTWVFVDGNLAGVVDAQVGPVISFLPIILMGVLFGLAMDYEMFLVGRVREEYVRTGDARAAVEQGFVDVARVVSALALIMVAVFAAFVPNGDATIKPIAFALAVGVAVDAFVVRMTLVPAVLALLGDRAWWLPSWLDRRLPELDAEGEQVLRERRLADWPEPGSDEVVSAAGWRWPTTAAARAAAGGPAPGPRRDGGGGGRRAGRQDGAAGRVGRAGGGALGRPQGDGPRPAAAPRRRPAPGRARGLPRHPRRPRGPAPRARRGCPARPPRRPGRGGRPGPPRRAAHAAVRRGGGRGPARRGRRLPRRGPPVRRAARSAPGPRAPQPRAAQLRAPEPPCRRGGRRRPPPDRHRLLRTCPPPSRRGRLRCRPRPAPRPPPTPWAPSSGPPAGCGGGWRSCPSRSWWPGCWRGPSGPPSRPAPSRPPPW